jgi:hypothetical protein
LDIFISASFIIKSDVKEEGPPPYSKDVMTNSKEETMNMEDTTLTATPQSTTSSNDLKDPPMETGSIQYVRKKMW